jgi:hypothetical protein
MGIKSAIIKTYARRVTRYTAQWSHHALESQDKMMKLLVDKASLTQFGKEHNFHKIVTYYDFRHLIPVSRISDLQDFVHQIKKGGKDILWPGRPKYLLHSGDGNQDLIPVTRESLSGYYDGLKMLLFNQVDWIDKHKVFKGKILFLTSPHHPHKAGGIQTGDVNWIYTQKIPAWLKSNVIWVEMFQDKSKLQTDVLKTLEQDIRLIIGSSELLSVYMKEVLQQTEKKSMKEVFLNLSTVVISQEYNSANTTVESFKKVEGIAYLKMYVSAIGCWAFQDRLNSEDVLLNVNSGLFFEFIAHESEESESPKRYKLSEVAAGVPYKLIMSNNAGCWACDTDLHIKFTDIKPFRLEVIV